MRDPSLASSSTSPPSFVLQQRDASKLSIERNLLDSTLPVTQPTAVPVLEHEQLQARPALPRRLFANVSRGFALRHPRAYWWIKRVVLYARGPRPKVDLPRKFLLIITAFAFSFIIFSNKTTAGQKISLPRPLYLPLHRVRPHQSHPTADSAVAIRYSCSSVHNRFRILRSRSVIPHTC